MLASISNNRGWVNATAVLISYNTANSKLTALASDLLQFPMSQEERWRLSNPVRLMLTVLTATSLIEALPFVFPISKCAVVNPNKWVMRISDYINSAGALLIMMRNENHN